MHTERTVVVGAGPAGLAAACQLSLYGLSPLVLEAHEPGGLLLNAGSVRNYPGVPSGVTGVELAKKFPMPERLIRESVTSIERNTGGIYRTSWTGGHAESHSVIVASGTVPVRIPLPGVDPDRIFYQVRNVPEGRFSSAAVIGGGDAALDYAITLSGRMKVNVYARSGFRGAVPHLLTQASENFSISLFPNHKEFSSFNEDVVVVACGRRPNVGFVSEDLLCSPPEDHSFHLCGDCANGIFRQVSIAVGDGVRAAMKTAEYLRKRILSV